MTKSLLNVAIKSESVPGSSTPTDEELRNLYPSSYGQPRETTPGANAWFNQGGKLFGQQLSPKIQNLLAFVGEMGLAGGPAVQVSKKASSAVASQINKAGQGALNVANITNPSVVMDDVVAGIKARNRKSVNNIENSKGPTFEELEDLQKNNWTVQDLEDLSNQKPLSETYGDYEDFYDVADDGMWEVERDMVAEWFYDKLDKVPPEYRNDVWVQKILNDFNDGMFGISGRKLRRQVEEMGMEFPKPPESASTTLHRLGLDRYEPRHFDNLLNEVNVGAAGFSPYGVVPGTGGARGVLPKLIKPQGVPIGKPGTNPRAISQFDFTGPPHKRQGAPWEPEYYDTILENLRKQGIIGEGDVDFHTMPSFMRNKLGKWKDDDLTDFLNSL